MRVLEDGAPHVVEALDRGSALRGERATLKPSRGAQLVHDLLELVVYLLSDDIEVVAPDDHRRYGLALLVLAVLLDVLELAVGLARSAKPQVTLERAVGDLDEA